MDYPRRSSFYAVFVVFSLCIVCLAYTPSYAFIFVNGAPTVYTDVFNGDSYFGGSDLGLPGAQQQLPSTSMTFNVNGGGGPLPIYNAVGIIVGGSLNTAALSSTILGDVNLDISDTRGGVVYGGGAAINAQAPAIVRGTINITLTRSSFANVYGGGYEAASSPSDRDRGNTSAGAIKIRLIESYVEELTGSASSVGLNGRNRIAVEGNIDISIENHSTVPRLIGTSSSSAHVGGDLNIIVKSGSIVDDLTCIGHGALLGNLNATIENNNTLVTNFSITEESPLFRTATIRVIDGARIENFVLGSIPPPSLRIGTGPTSVNIVNVSLETGANIGAFNIGAPILNMANSVNLTVGNACSVDRVIMESGNIIPSLALIKFASINVNGGTIREVQLCPNRGSAQYVKLALNGGQINEVKLGTASGQGGVLVQGALEISAGTIGKIRLLSGLQTSTLTFLPGGKSSIIELQGDDMFGGINVEKRARTSWGRNNQRFAIGGEVVELSGIIEIPSGSTIEFTVGKRLVINNPKFIVQDTAYSRTEPFIVLNGLPGSSAEVSDPIDLDLSLSPGYLQKDKVLLATATSPLARPDIFETNNRLGFIWSGVFFEKNSWYLTNFEISRDYSGFSSTAMATSWLRQEHLDVTQNRSRQALLDKRDGFWADVRGGHEKIDVSLGESEMPWFMASAGYDKNKRIGERWSAIYGVALGADVAYNKWSDFNKVESTITAGLVSGYVGLGADLGFYGLGTLQLSLGGVRTNAPGFLLKKTWTEFTPSESFELGWRFRFSDAFSVTPRAQIVLEHMLKRKISFSYLTDDEEIILDGSTALTGVFGLGAAYAMEEFKLFGSVDWIKGMSGDYGVHSKFFNKKMFDEKNDNSVVRITVGGSYNINEKMSVGASVFGDLGDNKGIGGQADFSYKF